MSNQRSQYDQMMNATHDPNRVEKYIPINDMNSPPNRTPYDMSDRAEYCGGCNQSAEKYIPLRYMNTKLHRTSYDESMLTKYNPMALGAYEGFNFENTGFAHQTPYNPTSFWDN